VTAAFAAIYARLDQDPTLSVFPRLSHVQPLPRAHEFVVREGSRKKSRRVIDEDEEDNDDHERTSSSFDVHVSSSSYDMHVSSSSHDERTNVANDGPTNAVNDVRGLSQFAHRARQEHVGLQGLQAKADLSALAHKSIDFAAAAAGDDGKSGGLQRTHSMDDGKSGGLQRTHSMDDGKRTHSMDDGKSGGHGGGLSTENTFYGVDRARADERIDLLVRDVEAAERLLAKITRTKLEDVKLMVLYAICQDNGPIRCM